MFLREYFGVGRNGVRERAWGRINGGHFDMKTMRSAVCKCRTTSGIDPVRIFSIKCTPSKKKDAYTVYLVFRTSNDKVGVIVLLVIYSVAICWLT